MDSKLYDSIIIGAGPAGLAAALYTSRANLSTLVIEKGPSGGQIALTEAVENYPGFPDHVTGPELADKFEQQAKKFGAEVINGTVTDIIPEGKLYKIIADKKEYMTRTIICSMGADPKKLGIPGEDKNVGTGVSYCATCDGAFFRNKKVVVIGGGDAAIEEGLFLTRFADQVTIVHRRDQLRASKILQDRAFAHEKIDFIWDTVPTEIISEGTVSHIKLKNVKTKEEYDHPIDGVFIFIGHIPNTKLVADLVELDETNLINVDLNMNTSRPGIYACGDCRTQAARQLASSAGDGVTAALTAEKYIDEMIVEEEAAKS
jgi:thioredoxin reductase (NADPH)